MNTYETHVQGQDDYSWSAADTPAGAAIVHAAHHCHSKENYTDSVVVCVLVGDDWKRYDVEPTSAPTFAVRQFADS